MAISLNRPSVISQEALSNLRAAQSESPIGNDQSSLDATDLRAKPLGKLKNFLARINPFNRSLGKVSDFSAGNTIKTRHSSSSLSSSSLELAAPPPGKFQRRPNFNEKWLTTDSRESIRQSATLEKASISSDNSSTEHILTAKTAINLSFQEDLLDLREQASSLIRELDGDPDIPLTPEEKSDFKGATYDAVLNKLSTQAEQLESNKKSLNPLSRNSGIADKQSAITVLKATKLLLESSRGNQSEQNADIVYNATDIIETIQNKLR